MNRSLALICPSMGGHEEAVTTWQDTMSKPWTVQVLAESEGEEAGFLAKCERGWRSTDADVVGFLHSDLFILEHGWDQRVLDAFANENVVVVGFVGATRLGHPDIYRVPYDYRQLARGDVWSNLTDAESHGGRDAGSRRVAVVDSCAVFVRREFLRRLGGWPVGQLPNSSHCSDLWICCAAHRARGTVMVVGVAATHRSGGKGSVGAAWLEAKGGDESVHREAHRWLYDNARDVLPIVVEPEPAS